MQAIRIMSALAQPTRLDVFRRLVDALPDGMAASDIADATGTSRASMSAHLAILDRAGIVTSLKSGRSVIYTADTTNVEGLSDFLSHACARGRDSRGRVTP